MGIKLQESPFVHVGVELVQGNTFSVMLTQSDFAENLQPIPNSPKLWAARQKLLSPGNVHMRQCNPGELCWLAAVSRPDICARLARIASRINSLRCSDVYCINDLIKTAKTWQKGHGSQMYALLFTGDDQQQP